MFNTLPGKIFCQVLVVALALPSISLSLVNRVEAKQLTQRKLWAVLPFSDSKNGKYGGVASDAFSTELSKRAEEFRPAIDVAAPDTVTRTLSSLGLTPPVTDQTTFERVGQELRANTLVRGNVLNYRIIAVPGGRQAQVLIRVEAINVASGLPINGAAIEGQSTVRGGKDITDDGLITEAISAGSASAVGEILGRTLPTGTVLNTTSDNVLINQGTRTGFSNGQKVIVTRGREQVATGLVRNVEADQSELQITRSTKGVEPGDSVQVVFEVPTIANVFGTNGPTVKHAARHGNNAGLISVLLVVALGVILFAGGNGSSNSPFGNVYAEATTDPNNPSLAADQVFWRTDIFAKGTSQRFSYQIYRNDVQTSPVLVQTDPNQSSIYDTTTQVPTSFLYAYFGGVVGGTTCLYTAPPLTTPTVLPPAITPGRPYIYSVELVYDLSSLDLPGTASSGSTSSSTSSTSSSTSSTSSSSTTGTTNTTGSSTTTGSTTGSTTSTSSTSTSSTSTSSTSTSSTSGTATSCYFVTGKTTANGTATPLTPATLTTPANGATLTGSTPFTYNSVANASTPIAIQYVIEFSSSPIFAAGTVYTTAPTVSNATGVLSAGSLTTSASPFPSYIINASTVYWRVGARNIADSPGPVPDPSGNRYVFSPYHTFLRSTTVVPPPPTINSVGRGKK